MMAYRLLYSQTSRKLIKSLHPEIKSLVKFHVQQLKENPHRGKALERELSGYYSLRMKRFRVIYEIDHFHHAVHIHYAGHRKNIYELFREILEKV
jgi:mRNA interferase RelE/StbE